MTNQSKQQAPLIQQSKLQKFGEFIAYSTFTLALIIFAALAFSISYFTLTWAFGLR